MPFTIQINFIFPILFLILKIYIKRQKQEKKNYFQKELDLIFSKAVLKRKKTGDQKFARQTTLPSFESMIQNPSLVP